jgi:hypothetical protein
VDSAPPDWDSITFCRSLKVTNSYSCEKAFSFLSERERLLLVIPTQLI